jgi:hypothetical protein
MTAAAERQRRHRERESSGRQIVNVEIDIEVVELLVESHLLPRRDFHDRADIGEAIGRFLSLARRA